MHKVAPWSVEKPLSAFVAVSRLPKRGKETSKGIAAPKNNIQYRYHKYDCTQNPSFDTEYNGVKVPLHNGNDPRRPLVV